MVRYWHAFTYKIYQLEVWNNVNVQILICNLFNSNTIENIIWKTKFYKINLTDKAATRILNVFYQLTTRYFGRIVSILSNHFVRRNEKPTRITAYVTFQQFALIQFLMCVHFIQTLYVQSLCIRICLTLFCCAIFKSEFRRLLWVYAVCLLLHLNQYLRINSEIKYLYVLNINAIHIVPPQFAIRAVNLKQLVTKRM